MINVRDGALREQHKEFMDYIHQDVINKSKDGLAMMKYYMPSNMFNMFERYEDELTTLLKESGYHVSKVANGHDVAHFMISWERKSSFFRDKLKRSKWWDFWE